MYSYRFQAAFIVIIALLFCQATGASAKSLVIPGTGANERVLSILAEAFNVDTPLDKVNIPPSIGSSGAIDRVIEDRANIVRVARKLKDTEAAHGLSYIPFAKDAVVFATGSRAGVSNISSAQLVGLFSGSISDWQQVGGATGSINVLARDRGESSLSIIQSHIVLFENIKLSDNAKILYHDYEMIEMLEKYSRSIGFGVASAMKDKNITVLAVDGVEPTAGNIMDGTYKMVIEYAFVLRPGQTDSLSQSFMDFVFSHKGKAILRKSGLIPLVRDFK